jgi:uracil-DNA glycosylase family 4
MSIEKLNIINDNVSKCKRCPKNDACIYPTHGIFPENLDDIKVVFIGQAPGVPLKEEIEWTKTNPDVHEISKFYRQAMSMSKFGKWLNIVLRLSDLNWKNVAFLNVIKCYPQNHKITKEIENNCKNYFYEQLNYLNASVYVCLGSYALKMFLRNKEVKVSSMHSKRIEYSDKSVLIYSYHPSYIFRQNIEHAKVLCKQLVQSIRENVR